MQNWSFVPGNITAEEVVADQNFACIEILTSLDSTSSVVVLEVCTQLLVNITVSKEEARKVIYLL